jgi:BON domain
MDPDVILRVQSRVEQELVRTGRVSPSDFEIVFRRDVIVLKGAVDDAFTKGAIELVVSTTEGATVVRSLLIVREDLGGEAAAKETEFGTRQAARAMTGVVSAIAPL